MSTFPVAAKVTGDVSGFVSAMGASQGALRAFAGSAGLATAAFAAFAGAAGMGLAIGAAREYQAELIKLNTLVGIQQDQVDEWAESMQGIATATGQAPADLARAMFAITSGGARGAEALAILEQTAKASAIGLGDMVSIGRTATAVLQAFGDEGLTAQKAIDVMVATVREGNLEAESLAGAFSRVLGPAKAVGVSFEEIGGFMATFTRLGGSTEQAATGLLNTFNLLIKPPKDAEEAMSDYIDGGLNELRRVIADDGLIAGLDLLNEAFDGNLTRLGQLVPNSRALIAVLNTISLQGEQYRQVQDNINNSLGMTAEGFLTWADSADAAFKMFTSQMQVTGVQLGENLLPPLTALLKVLGAVSEVLRFSIEGWEKLFAVLADSPEFEGLVTIFNWFADRGAGLADQLGPEWEGLRQLFAALGGEVESTQESFEALDAFLSGMSLDQLREKSSGLRDDLEEVRGRIAEIGEEMAQVDPFEIDRDDFADLPRADRSGAFEAERRRRTEATAALNHELAQLTEREDALVTVLGRTNDAMRAVMFATEEASEAQREQNEEEQESAEAREKRLEAIAAIVNGLERERLELEKTTEEMIRYDLEQLRASEATIQRALEEHRLAEALRETARRVEEAERAEKRLAAEREREEKRLSRQRERDAERRREAVARAAERAELAKLQQDMREVADISTAMAASIGDAFNDVIIGTESVSDAFGDMVEEILKELQRLMIRKLIVQPIAEALFGALGGIPESPGEFPGPDIGTPDFKLPDPTMQPSITPKPSLPLPGLSSVSMEPVAPVPQAMVEPPTLAEDLSSPFGPAQPAPTTIVQQTINLSPQLIDGADGARWLRQNQTQIMEIVGRGAQTSSEYAAVLRGGVL